MQRTTQGAAALMERLDVIGPMINDFLDAPLPT
jgi:hypothetical protein